MNHGKPRLDGYASFCYCTLYKNWDLWQPVATAMALALTHQYFKEKVRYAPLCQLLKIKRRWPLDFANLEVRRQKEMFKPIYPAGRQVKSYDMNHLVNLGVINWNHVVTWWIQVESLHPVYFSSVGQATRPQAILLVKPDMSLFQACQLTFFGSRNCVASSNHTKNGWTMMRLYKLHIHPNKTHAGHIDHRIILQPTWLQTQRVLLKS